MITDISDHSEEDSYTLDYYKKSTKQLNSSLKLQGLIKSPQISINNTYHQQTFPHSEHQNMIFQFLTINRSGYNKRTKSIIRLFINYRYMSRSSIIDC
jgi:hypothetical protein